MGAEILRSDEYVRFGEIAYAVPSEILHKIFFMGVNEAFEIA